uniref:Peptide-methionine (R)-S-oxide reductase n=1 Tax=Branchiostoma floridae TaxID=7739 RepID=C3YPF9_BRAFL|eukprot:XP_002601731.1 hypothetical protein BRAFLDRAFT_76050 [Branchiostoma floridae]
MWPAFSKVSNVFTWVTLLFYLFSFLSVQVFVSVELQEGTCKQLGNCKMSFDKEELKKRLTPIQYEVTQEKGTERPFTGELNDETRPGLYKCVVCGAELFKSETKFDAGCGWPSFYDQTDEGAVTMTEDSSLGMVRTETTCSKCGAHLGHVFDDGPKFTGQRFCINSVSTQVRPQVCCRPRRKNPSQSCEERCLCGEGGSHHILD